MKKILLALAALATVGTAAPPYGADLGGRNNNKAPVNAAPNYNRTAFYTGGHLGGAFSGSHTFNRSEERRVGKD